MKEKILKHEEDTTIKKFDAEDFSVYYKRPYELLHTYSEIFTNEIYRFDSDQQDPVIIDCGSNIGLSIIYFKLLFPKARILAYEPDRNNFQLLQQNVSLNHFTDVQLNPLAVWTNSGSISFESNESEASHISADSNGKEVQAIRLQEVLLQFPSIDFLKIDIEGAEWEVIRDCREALKNVKNLFLEYHGKIEDSGKLNEILSIVREAGLYVYVRNAADTIEHPFVQKRSGSSYDVQLNLFCYR